MTTQLDSFEADLLAELRTVVAARAAAPAPAAEPRRRAVRPWALVPVGLATAAVALLVAPGIGPEPAYAVTVDGNGEVHVRVHRLEDASGLEAALQAQGIAADVQYLAEDHECAPDRYTDAPSRSGAFSFSAGSEYGYRVDLGPGAVRPGETLVIAASRTSPLGDPDGDGISDEGGSWVSVGIAAGRVAPCVPLPRSD